MRFAKQDLIDGLYELGARTLASGKIIDIAVYGGSCLMLVSNFRDASQDVDAVAASDQAFIDRCAMDIAEKRNWPRDWLNDGVRAYLSPKIDLPEDHILFRSYPSEKTPGLRVFVPTAEYMLAMKLMAMRIDETQDRKDLSDLLSLIRILGIKHKDALIALAAGYYPDARVSPKLVLAADRLLHAAAEETANEAPRYLGRGGRG